MRAEADPTWVAVRRTGQIGVWSFLRQLCEPHTTLESVRDTRRLYGHDENHCCTNCRHACIYFAYSLVFFPRIKSAALFSIGGGHFIFTCALISQEKPNKCRVCSCEHGECVSNFVDQMQAAYLFNLFLWSLWAWHRRKLPVLIRQLISGRSRLSDHILAVSLYKVRKKKGKCTQWSREGCAKRKENLKGFKMHCERWSRERKHWLCNSCQLIQVTLGKDFLK